MVRERGPRPHGWDCSGGRGTIYSFWGGRGERVKGVCSDAMKGRERGNLDAISQSISREGGCMVQPRRDY